MIEISTGVVLAFTAVVGLIVSLVTIVARQAVANTRNEQSARAARAVADEAKLASANAATVAAQTAKELAEFRERVAQNYASRDAIRELESKLVAAIERLGDRFDKYVDKEK